MQLSSLVSDCLGRVEENLPTDAYLPGPTFWSLVGEVYPQMVDGTFEASLITGVVQAVNKPFAITKNTTYFKTPKGYIAPLRLRAPYPIRKVSLKGLDDMIPNWQKAAPGTQLQAWFPLGVSGFGVYPQLANDASVNMDWIQSPVNEARPYTGNETLPFQEEFTDAFSQYAAAMLRCKEGGQEAEEASVVYQEYLGRMKALSLFQNRLDSLVLTKAYGGNVQTNTREVV